MASLNFARGETYYIYGRQNTKQKLHDMLEFFDQFLKDKAVTVLVGGSE